jgi:NAD dependent epimerase/dehydratase family enzyme
LESNLAAAKEMDAVVHLAGENVATGMGPFGFLGLRPWTYEKKGEILNSAY